MTWRWCSASPKKSPCSSEAGWWPMARPRRSRATSTYVPSILARGRWPMANDLALDRVTAGYGPTVVLDDLSLNVGAGECLALLGRNGVGKTTLLLTIMGHTVCSGGSVRLGGVDITRWPVWKRSRFGVGLVPQEREIFRSLSVEENLQVAARSGGFTVEQTYDLFPRLAERRRNKGNQLSGGEQQMLSIGRAMMGGPKLLLLDEP